MIDEMTFLNAGYLICTNVASYLPTLSRKWHLQWMTGSALTVSSGRLLFFAVIKKIVVLVVVPNEDKDLESDRSEKACAEVDMSTAEGPQ